MQTDDRSVDIVIEEAPAQIRRVGRGPSPFEVSLTTYPMQPWTNKNANLSQWFNYGFNPATWSRHACEQVEILKSNK